MLRRAAATATAVMLIALLGGLSVQAVEGYAELHITGITLDPPSTITRGIGVEVRARVMNTGARNVDQFGIGIFYRPAASMGSWLLADMIDDASLAASQEGFLDVSFTLETAELELGTYEVRVVADPMNQVSEVDEYNNELRTTFTVIDSKLGLPDLQPVSLVFSRLNPESDDDMLPWNVTAVVENPAGEQAGAFSVVFLLDGVEFDRKFLFALPANGATEVVGELDPYELGLLPGTYAISVVVDLDDQVIEQDEGNNTISSALALQSPDVFPTSITFDKTVVRLDEEVRISAEIRNGGAGTAKGVEVGLYVGQVRFASAEIDLIGRGLSVSVEGILVPDALGLDDAPAVHQIRVVVDPNNRLPELDEANNLMTRSLTILAPALKRSELHLESVELNPASPIELGRSSTLTVSTVVANTGRAAAEDFDLAFYYRVKGAVRWEPFSCADGLSCHIASLASGAQTRVNATLSLGLLTAGVYEVRASADSTGVIDELDESNNTLVTTLTLLAARLPDLSFCLAQPVTIAPSTQVHKGQTLRLDACISNVGDAEAGAFDVRFAYAQESQIVNATQAATEREFVSAYFSPSSEVEISSLPIGETAQVPVLLETNQLDPGSYTLRVEVDPASGTAPSGRVIERNELNNQMLLQMMVLGADLAAADLVSSHDNVAAQGELVEFVATILNAGVAPAGAFTVGFKISRAGDEFEAIRIWTCGDDSPTDCIGPAYFGYARLPGIDLLVPEAAMCTLDTSELEPGDYVVRVEVDVDGTVPEHDELNNALDLPLTIIEGEDGQSQLPPGTAGADLWVERFDAVAGNPGRSHLWGTITNLGAVASGPFNVAFYYVPVPGGELVQVATRAIENLEPGETRTTLRTIETADWEPGYYDVRIVVDPDNEILELNEENNAKDEELRVR